MNYTLSFCTNEKIKVFLFFISLQKNKSTILVNLYQVTHQFTIIAFHGSVLYSMDDITELKLK